MMAAMLRKLTTGQPGWVEGIAAIPVAMFGVWALVNERLPRTLFFPLLLWFWFSVIYVIPAIAQAPIVGASAIGTRIVPLFMAPVAYCCIRTPEDLRRVAFAVGIWALPFAGIALYVTMMGDADLPSLLRPAANVSEQRVQVLKGYFVTASAVFSTPTALGYFGLVTAALMLTLLAFPNSVGRRVLPIALLGCALVLIYLSGRRMMLLQVFIMSGVFLIATRRVAIAVVIAMMLASLIVWSDARTQIRGGLDSRSAHLLQGDVAGETLVQSVMTRRIGEYVIDNTIHHVEVAPMGRFLGARGQEAIAAGLYQWNTTDRDDWIETGSVLLASEMGLLGLLIQPIVSFGAHLLLLA